MQFGQFGFVVKGIDVRHATGDVKPDDAFGSGCRIQWVKNPVPALHLSLLAISGLHSR